MDVQQTVFQLERYHFPKFFYDASLLGEDESNQTKIGFSPSGEYDESLGSFVLCFSLILENSLGEIFAQVDCEAEYRFQGQVRRDDIPEHFYSSSISILYPYLRAFLTMMTTQSNNRGIILPVLNLTGLGRKLQDNTMVIEHGAGDNTISSES